jgi:hypothetical protein
MRFGKHVHAVTNTHATIVTVGKGVLYSVRARGYKEDNWGDPVSSELSSAREAVKIGLEHMKLKNLHC